ncbi:MAG: SDR family NAD(P)-dependent oxidoreductase, partial [Pseudomonadales bacterium]
GNIVMIGSLGGLIPTWGYSAYSTSKAALVGLAEVLDSELRPAGIKVSLVCPSEAATPMIAAEAASVPVQTRFLKDLLGTTTAEAVAESTLAGVEKGKSLIIHGFRGKSAYLIKRLFPNSMRVSTALILARLDK